MNYRIRNFFYKLKRSFNWFIFMWTLDPWEEDYQFLEVIERYLLDMSKHFEKVMKNSDILSLENDIKWTKLLVKLIRMDIEDYYENLYKADYTKGFKQQEKLQRLIFKILAEKLHTFWI